jgi:hypothetical protein
VKAAADRLRSMRAETTANAVKQAKKQRSIDHDFRILKKREAKFDSTKQEHLAWNAQQRATAGLLGRHVDILRDGTPAQKIESLGFLTGQDGMAAWEGIVQGMAGVKKQANPEIEAIRQELREERAERARERDAARQHAEFSQKRTIVENRKAQILEGAKDATTYPTLAKYVGVRPQAVIDELVSMKSAYKAETGEALSDSEAMLQLDQQLALLLRQEGSGAGTPRLEESRNPGGKPNLSSSAKKAGSVAGIPPSASSRVAPTRPATDEELRQELTPDYWASLGLG